MLFMFLFTKIIYYILKITAYLYIKYAVGG